MLKQMLLLSVSLFLLFCSVSQAQELEWTKSAGAWWNDQGNGISVDASGNSYVTGLFRDSTTFGTGEPNETTLVGRKYKDDIFIAKYNPDGELLWVKGVVGVNGNHVGNGIAVDSSGNAFVTGIFVEIATFGAGESGETTLISKYARAEVFIAKYKTDGKLLWAKIVGGKSGNGVAIDSLGNSYVTGVFRRSATFGTGEANETTLTGGDDEIFIAKYNPDGELLWAKSAGGNLSDWGNGISVDASGNSYVTGYFLSDSATFGAGEPNETTLSGMNGYKIFIAKYNTDGGLLWAKSAGGSSWDSGNSISTDSLGNSYVTGRFEDSPTFGVGEPNETTLTSKGEWDIFIAKYGPIGELLWAKSTGGSIFDEGKGISVDASDNFYVTGYCFSTTFGAGEPNETTVTGYSVFITKYNPDGELLWARSVGGSSTGWGNGIAVDASGNSYVTGFFRDLLTFGAGEPNETTLTSNGAWDIFIAKYSQNSAVLNNPTTDIKANGSDGPITLGTSDTLSVSISLAAGSSLGEGADWWVVVNTPFGLFHYDVPSGSWIPGLIVTVQGSLFNLTLPVTVLSMSGLPSGNYTFYFCVDMVMNGSLDMSDIFFDSVIVNITP